MKKGLKIFSDKINMLKISELFASWFGVGYLPWMPGTFGTLAAFLLTFPLLLQAHHLRFSQKQMAILFLILSLLTFVIGLFSSHLILKNEESSDNRQRDWDPSWIVIDEVSGFWLALGLTMFFIPLTLLVLCLNFVIFRILDIQKPWPIRSIERSLAGSLKTAALGIMLDDWIAGFFTSLIVVLIWTR